jgi:hypothetical protein
VNDAGLSAVGKDVVRLRCAAGTGEMWVSVTRDRIRIGTISDKDQQKNLHERVVRLIEKFLKIVATFWKFPHPIRIRECHLGTYIGIFQVIGQCKNMETSQVIRKFISLC